MKPNKENILAKTHYGLNIYAHILKQYYPADVVLSLSGRDCQPVKNPFNNHKPTLKIAIVNNCAMHHDWEDPSNKGDAFSFAAMHYQLEGEALYHKLNEAMHLQLDKLPPGCMSPRTGLQPASPIAD